jgi:ketosteroid isomerase-like protein
VRDRAELVRRLYSALNAGDVEALSLLLDADACWHTPGRSPIAGDYVGRDAVLGHFTRYAGTFHAEPPSVAAADGRVVAIHAGCCTVFEIRDGRIVDGREHVFDLHAWDAYWSSRPVPHLHSLPWKGQLTTVSARSPA